MSNEDPTSLSLDEIIRRNKANRLGNNKNGKKKEKEEIDMDDLDASLEQISRRNAYARGMKPRSNCGSDKFARFKDDNDSESDDDRIEHNGQPDPKIEDGDVEMEDESTVEHENPPFRNGQCHFNGFKTIESELGVKVRPQQWRLNTANLERPTGVPRLTALPLGEREHFRKVHNGRVQKSYKKNKQEPAEKVGIFVEKGNFTYKYGTSVDESEDVSPVGIVRNKPITKIITRNHPMNNREGYSHGDAGDGGHYFNTAPPESSLNQICQLFKTIEGIVQSCKTPAPSPPPVEPKVVNNQQPINYNRVQPLFPKKPAAVKTTHEEFSFAASSVFQRLKGNRSNETATSSNNESTLDEHKGYEPITLDDKPLRFA